ncbi:hypothetical protein DFH06DRAFT_1132736 [Mycena polygramma]|nr:hypothetical protein DFH06DRAFT_1132730 [Mycena polygramma]KAJ7655635.1 hypothetical protein DFH06DRAFT_1132733 [Mycena polygramma]KAJ7655639.1 hypothetical protein DFH06DRAFT_1132736 [Mycena polygramma]
MNVSSEKVRATAVWVLDAKALEQVKEKIAVGRPLDAQGSRDVSYVRAIDVGERAKLVAEDMNCPHSDRVEVAVYRQRVYARWWRAARDSNSSKYWRIQVSGLIEIDSRRTERMRRDNSLVENRKIFVRELRMLSFEENAVFKRLCGFLDAVELPQII